jgi:hypothetical protein
MLPLTMSMTPHAILLIIPKAVIQAGHPWPDPKDHRRQGKNQGPSERLWTWWVQIRMNGGLRAGPPFDGGKGDQGCSETDGGSPPQADLNEVFELEGLGRSQSFNDGFLPGIGACAKVNRQQRAQPRNEPQYPYGRRIAGPA